MEIKRWWWWRRKSLCVSRESVDHPKRVWSVFLASIHDYQFILSWLSWLSIHTSITINSYSHTTMIDFTYITTLLHPFKIKSSQVPTTGVPIFWDFKISVSAFSNQSYLIFVTDVKDNVRVKKSVRCKIFQIGRKKNIVIFWGYFCVVLVIFGWKKLNNKFCPCKRTEKYQCA